MMSTPLLGVAGAAFVLTTLCLPLARWLAFRLGLVDHPDGHRKIHGRPIPLAGGLALLMGVVLAGGLVFTISPDFRGAMLANPVRPAGLLFALAVIALVGILDDRIGLRSRHKLAGQLVAVGALMLTGPFTVERFEVFGQTVELGLLAVPFAVFWFLGAMNAINLLDGMDGLLGTVGFFVAIALAGLLALQGVWWAAALALALAGGLAGFLFYNFPPASVFLGDCGSMVVGLFLGVLSLETLRAGPEHTPSLLIPLTLLVLPLFDTLCAIARRKLTGRGLACTDRGHLHHCLLARGLSPRQVLIVLAGLNTLAGLGVLTAIAFHNDLFALVAAVVVVGILVTTRLFGHAEFDLVTKRLHALALSARYGHETWRAHELTVRLQGSADWLELWRDLTAAAEHSGAESVRLDVNAPSVHEGYHARWDRFGADPSAADRWRAEVPLALGRQAVGRLTVVGRRGNGSPWEQMATLALYVARAERLLADLATPDPALTLVPAQVG
jgi:UDP-GlcNAc:undecaprenyl-phosphate/decaprenyl-phosphate GlcNAc-1-phosphate transferase